MSLDLLFTVSSIFAALVGLVALISPSTLSAGGSEMMFRGFGGVFIALAVLDWMARGAGPSKARNGIVLGNTVGFLLAAVFSALAAAQGNFTLGWVMAVISAVLAVWFFFTGMSSMQSAPSAPSKPSMPAAPSMPMASPASTKRPAKAPAKKAARKATKTARRRR